MPLVCGIDWQMFCLFAIIPISPANRNKNIYFCIFLDIMTKQALLQRTAAVIFHIEKSKVRLKVSIFVSL